MPSSMKRCQAPPLQVIVTVSGGVADVVYKPRGVAVTLHDYDVEGSDATDPGITTDSDGQLCCVRDWDPSEEIVGSEHWPAVKKARQGSYYRTWRCSSCGRMVRCTYEQLAESGTPYCPDCADELTLVE